MQENRTYPVIDCPATGRTILEWRKARGITVRELQALFGFENPQAIYKWQRGESLPSLDNLVALSRFLQVPMDELIVLQSVHTAKEPQASACGSYFFAGALPWGRGGRTAAILTGAVPAAGSGDGGGRQLHPINLGRVRVRRGKMAFGYGSRSG